MCYQLKYKLSSQACEVFSLFSFFDSFISFDVSKINQIMQEQPTRKNLSSKQLL